MMLTHSNMSLYLSMSRKDLHLQCPLRLHGSSEEDTKFTSSCCYQSSLSPSLTYSHRREEEEEEKGTVPHEAATQQCITCIM